MFGVVAKVKEGIRGIRRTIFNQNVKLPSENEGEELADPHGCISVNSIAISKVNVSQM